MFLQLYTTKTDLLTCHQDLVRGGLYLQRSWEKIAPASDASDEFKDLFHSVPSTLHDVPFCTVNITRCSILYRQHYTMFHSVPSTSHDVPFCTVNITRCSILYRQHYTMFHSVPSTSHDVTFCTVNITRCSILHRQHCTMFHSVPSTSHDVPSIAQSWSIIYRK